MANEGIYTYILLLFLGFYAFLLDRKVESRQESIGWREGGGIGRGPRDRNRTRVAVGTAVLYFGALSLGYRRRLMGIYLILPLSYCSMHVETILPVMMYN